MGNTVGYAAPQPVINGLVAAASSERLRQSVESDLMDQADTSAIREPTITMPPAPFCDNCYSDHYGPCFNGAGGDQTQEDDGKKGIPPSDEVTLMEGVLNDAYVRTLCVSALSNDVLESTDIASSFTELLGKRVAFLDTVNTALCAARDLQRKTVIVPASTLKSSTAVLQMNMRLIASLLGSDSQITYTSPLCGHLLDSLSEALSSAEELLSDAGNSQSREDQARPLSLAFDPEAKEWCKNVSDWLVSLLHSAFADETEKAKAVATKALGLLLRLIVQQGSLVATLKTIELLQKTKRDVRVDEFAFFVRLLGRMRNVSVINHMLTPANPTYVGNWRFIYPNHTGATATAEESQQEETGGHPRFRRGRGRMRMYGRNNDEPSAPVTKQETAEGYSAIAVSSGGLYLFVHTQDGLVKVGTGLQHTIEGQLYRTRFDFRTTEAGNLACVGDYVFFRSPQIPNAKTSLLVLSASTLEDVGVVVLPDNIKVVDYAPLFSSLEHLYLVTGAAVDDDSHAATWKLLEFSVEPSADSAVPQLKLTRSLAIEGMDDSVPRSYKPCDNCSAICFAGDQISCTKCHHLLCYECEATFHKSQGHESNLLPGTKAQDMDFLAWYPPKVQGIPPPARFGHTMVAVGTHMYVFGGASGHATSYEGAPTGIDMLFNDMHVLDVQNVSWITPEAVIEQRKHQEDELDDEKKAANDQSSAELDPERFTVGDGPTPRLGHSCVVHGTDLYFFGGGQEDTGKQVNNEMYVFHTATAQWSRPQVSGLPPEPRMFHTAVASTDQKRMYVYGGKCENGILSDLYAFHFESHKWSRIAITGVCPPLWGSVAFMWTRSLVAATSSSSSGASAAAAALAADDDEEKKEQLVLVCGRTKGDMSYKVWYIDLTDYTKAELNPATTARRPLVRFRHFKEEISRYSHYICMSTFALTKNKLYVIGGFNDGSYAEGASCLDLESFTWQLRLGDQVTGMSKLSYHGFAAGAVHGGRLYIFGGCCDWKTMNDLETFQIKADPTITLTDAALREGSFYCDGATLCALIPPLVAPNVVRGDEYLIRSFSLEGVCKELIPPSLVKSRGPKLSHEEQRRIDKTKACFFEDRYTGPVDIGRHVVYDCVNHLLWSYDRKKQTIHRWVDTASHRAGLLPGQMLPSSLWELTVTSPDFQSTLKESRTS